MHPRMTIIKIQRRKLTLSNPIIKLNSMLGILFDELDKNYFMQNRYAYFSIFLLFLISFQACKSEGESSYREDSSGPISLVSVFSSEEMYQQLESGLQDSLVFGKVFPGLYYPPEVMFATRHFKSDLLNRFKTTRLVLDVQEGEPSFEIEKNKFSRPQAYVTVSGNSAEEILSLLRENQKAVLDIYRWADHEFVLNGLKSKARPDNSMLEKLNVDLIIPHDYQVVKDENNFVWFRKDVFNTIQNVDERDQGIVSDSSQDILNILVFKIPYDEPDITMEKAHHILDSITKVYTKGSREPRDVYVPTNSGQDSIKTSVSDHIQVEPNPMLSDYYDFRLLEENENQNVYETQGWWSMTLSQLGGPFTAKFIIDKQNKQLYVADAVMFAPLNQGVSKKRDYILAMESLFTTFKIKP